MTQTSTPTRSGSVTPTLDPSDPLDPTEFDTELYTEDTEEPDLSELSLADDPDPPSIAPGGTDEAEDLELERFRNEWQDELHNRRKDGTGGSGPSKRWAELERKNQMEQNIPRESGSVRPAMAIDVVPEPIASGSNTADSPKASAAIRHMPLDEDEDEGDEEMGSGLALGTIQRKQAANQPVVGDRKEQAVALYARAVEHEQSGKLNEALMMYRKAFRLDDNVDRSYAKSANIAAAQAAAASPDLADIPSSADIVSSAAPIEEPYSFQRHLQLQPDYEKSSPLHPTQRSTRHASASTSTRLSPLTTILSRLPVPADQIEFIPSDENLPLPLSKLPIELLDPILGYLDVASIERFALTCWRARYVSSRAPKWKRIVEGLYKPPGILSLGKSVKDLDVMAKYTGEWRTALIEEERVRMDGCYISVCHYIRPGAGDQWVTITHMITYHRFLRFYPDGTVISFLTTDHPSEVVPLLRPSIRGKGLHFGRWRLIRSDSPENDATPLPHSLVDGQPAPPVSIEIDGPRKPNKEEKKRARIVITDLMEPGTESPKYEFEMELALRETGRGRWNKLDILNYQSINLANGESLGLSLKHQKPFYFSKVKSYHPQL